MKYTVITVLLLLLFTSTNYSQSNDAEYNCGLPFDSYGHKTNWNEERAHLDNFAYYLKQKPQFIGYIYIFTEKDESGKMAKSRSSRILKYLTQNIGSGYEVEKSRIVFIYKTNADRSEVMLQPILKEFKPPQL